MVFIVLYNVLNFAHTVNMREVGSLRFTPQTPISIGIPRFSNNFLKTFISLMKQRKCKVCLAFLSHRMPNRCRSKSFTFLTDGYAFVRLVGVIDVQ